MPTSSKKGPRSRGRTGGKFYRAKARVLDTNRICQFKGNDKWPPCGKLIDLDLKYPDPMSATVNHIIPVSDLAWDDPLTYDVENLEPMHNICNKRLGNSKPKPRKHKTSRDWLE